MPGVIETITFLAISAQAGALGAGVVAVGSAYGSILATVASVGLSYLSSVLFQPQQPKPEDVQVSVKNPTVTRQRHYGRVKTTGPWVFAESKGGELHKVIALGTGELDAIEELWVDDSLVTVDGNGAVQEDPWPGELTILTRLGLSTETYYSELESVFPEWDNTHRGDGVSSLYAIQRPTSADSFSEKFPNSVNTLYRVVARASKVYNPATETTVWSDNAAAVIRDYMTHPDGMRLPSSMVTTTQATAGWLAAFNRCAIPIDKKAGGTEDAYRIWGTYKFDERPADVLGRMLQCCDGRIVPTPDGGVTLDVGTWEEPTVIIDEDCITGFADVTRGRDITTTANVIRATYLSPTHDYQATDADPWIDAADVSERGEIAQDGSYNMAPSHGQARRLMKLSAYRANPDWVGTWSCNLRALAAFGKRFVRLQYPLFGIDEVVEIVDFRFNIQNNEDGIPHLIGVTLQVQSMPEEAYEWDPDTEEGVEPISEDVAVDNTIPVPANFTFTVDRINVGSQIVPVGIAAFDAAPSAALRVVGEYRLDSLGAEWNPITIADDATSGQTGVLADGEDYEARVRHMTITGRFGAWSAIETVSVVADTTPPIALTSFDIAGSEFLGHAPIDFVTANDARLNSVAFYRVATGGVLDTSDPAQFVTRRYVEPNRTYDFIDGDDSVANILTNGDLAGGATGWTSAGAGVTFTGGQVEHAAGAISYIQQAAAMPSGTSWRTKINVTAFAGGDEARIFLHDGTNGNTGTARSTVGIFLQTITTTADRNLFRVRWGSAADCDVDDLVLYQQTVDCAPAGTWDYYAVPENGSLVEGPPSGPDTVRIV